MAFERRFRKISAHRLVRGLGSDVDRDARKTVGDAHLDAPGVSHLAQLAGGFGGDDGERHLLDDGAVVRTHPGNGLKLARQLHEMRDRALETLQGSVGSIRFERAALQQPDPELERAERLPPLVRRHPRELLETRGLLLDGPNVERDERLDGRLCQHGHRLVKA